MLEKSGRSGRRGRENDLSNTQRHIVQVDTIGMVDGDDAVDSKMRRSMMQHGQYQDPYSNKVNTNKMDDAFDDLEFPSNFAEKQKQRMKVKEQSLMDSQRSKNSMRLVVDSENPAKKAKNSRVANGSQFYSIANEQDCME